MSTSPTLMAMSPNEVAMEDLPGIAPKLAAVMAQNGPSPDWSDRAAVIDYIVETERPYAGPDLFDEPWLRSLAGRVFDRTRDMAASMTSHFLVDSGVGPNASLRRLEGLPTLVLHGTADPFFGPAHARALTKAIPQARLIELDGVGHQLPPPPAWGQLVDALTEHTLRV